eukprot:CAMPEP_0182427666 /NCGR_PEP_ID=MMETSP1167-20130531/18959_1 /TAXON_ID=2988 /ORGANISM="Mallomonas Sp, Strain CCMP3275" /LENGTH=495 /DNA_ID=CAMNT_0024610065 /DNA_START=74 /DNA_END=1561 /DNA_ORIENTATION=+
MDSYKKGTPRYRKVGGQSNVDESLFISKDNKFGNSSHKGMAAIPTGSVVISRNELEKIKVQSVIKTESQIVAERERAQQLKEEKEQKARERKERMLMLEEQAKRHAKKSDVELEAEARAEAIRNSAKEKMNADADLQKMLNTLSARAAAFTIRDQQVQDKRRIESEEEEYEKRMDLVMELDRLKDLARREEEENKKRGKRVEAKKVIVDQIDERHRTKLLEAEAREQENLQMRALMQKYEEEDKSAAERRRIEVEKSKLEVLQANEEAIRRKQQNKVHEKMEVEEVLRYQAMKDAELAKREEEEMLLERQKKERQAKLLAMQERSQNKQAELDELRARRAAETRERDARRRDKEEAEKKRTEMLRLQDDRARQAQSKREKEEKLKNEQDEQFLKTLAYTELIAEREKEEEQKKKNAAKQHRDHILRQIEEAEAKRKRDRASKFEEGAKLREAEVKELTKLTVMKEQMVKGLESKGIDPIYLAEMKAVDVSKMLKR